eukprot:1041043-Amphidinium_carterae.1
MRKRWLATGGCSWQDGNAGAYYKAAGEMMAFAEDYQAACDLLGEAVALFKQEDPAKAALVKFKDPSHQRCH